VVSRTGKVNSDGFCTQAAYPARLHRRKEDRFLV
jgi:hypothetical protein